MEAVLEVGGWNKQQGRQGCSQQKGVEKESRGTRLSMFIFGDDGKEAQGHYYSYSTVLGIFMPGGVELVFKSMYVLNRIMTDAFRRLPTFHFFSPQRRLIMEVDETWNFWYPLLLLLLLGTSY